MIRALILVVAIAGCNRHLNPEWCATHTDPQCSQLPDGGVHTCTKDQDCVGGLVCDTKITGGACVECTDDKLAACPSRICIMSKCAACTSNANCPSEACLADGQCAVESSVLYVAPIGTGSACTRTAKCALGTAIGLAAPMRNTIVLDPGTYLGGVTIDRTAQLIGRSATIDANGGGLAVMIMNNVSVELAFLQVTGSNGDGINCTNGRLIGRAIKVTNNGSGISSACALDLDRSLVAGNAGGALVASGGSINVRNNFIVNNGSNGLMSSNVTIASAVTGAFRYNTVAYNVSKQNALPGIDCVSSALVAEGNLVTDNNQRGVFGASQVSGTCDFSKSYTQPGAGNNDLKWVDVTSDFHLTSQSTAVLDQAMSCSGMTDIDGEPRPMGAGCDFGADELKP